MRCAKRRANRCCSKARIFPRRTLPPYHVAGVKMNTRSRSSRVSGRRETVGRHRTTRVEQARASRGFTSSTMYISSVLSIGVALDGCPVVAPILSSSAWRLRPGHGILTPASECPIMPEEQRHVAQWQRITIYRYTLPPPYEATEHLFEELPLGTYP